MTVCQHECWKKRPRILLRVAQTLRQIARSGWSTYSHRHPRRDDGLFTCLPFAFASAANKLWIVGIALVLASLSPVRATLAGPLRVMTYNIHHAEGIDEVIDIQRIADVINAANPDIVSLQEVFQVVDLLGNPFFQLDDLATLTGMQGYFGPALTVPPGEIVIGEFGNGVLVSPGITITSMANHQLPLPSPTAPSEPRAVIEMGLSADGIDLKLFATHFDHASESNRLAQAAFINDLVAATTTPALLAGDLNAQGGTSTMMIVEEEWTNTSPPTLGQIDYALYRGTSQWNVIQQGAAIVNPLTSIASDHFPVLAVVEIVPEPSTFLLAVFGILGLPAFVRSRRS